LPPDRVKTNARRLVPDQSAEIVVYCASESCDASEKAARVLADLGYTNTRVYKGGKQDWIDSGLPVEGAEVVPTI
jgi:rhodanese-related sulfurtransferase